MPQEPACVLRGARARVRRTVFLASAALPEAQVRSRADKIPMRRTGEIAALAAFAASRECSFTTGFTFDATGGRAAYRLRGMAGHAEAGQARRPAWRRQ